MEISEKGFGFLRTAANHFHPKPTDIFVTPDTIRRNFLREGSHVVGTTQPPHRGTSPQLKTVEKVNDMPFEDYTKVVRFENLTSIDPIEKFQLETTPDLIETRVIDLVTPIGKGTRGIIVAPPRTGKTTILKQICNAITTNHPEVHAMVLLIDERPEEVTDFQRSVKAEVVASSNDMDLDTHVRLSRFMIERCRRIVEAGKDVFVLLDSLTRVARAYNSVHGGSGRTMTGGVDARALEIPRKMFASARKIENGGSLTILATALVDTGSRMDELIFQEFKGTGNMELILDRKLSDRRLYPAIDIPKSGTRKEEKLFPAKNLEAIRKLRRTMVDLNPIEAMETLTAALKKHKTNDELLAKMAMWFVMWLKRESLNRFPMQRFNDSTKPASPFRVRRWSGCCAFIRRLQAGGFPNASKLAREVEVSTKTIHRDIEFMRDRLNLPIEFAPANNGYFYNGEVSGFPTMQITEGEIFALVVAEKALQQYRGTSFEKPLLERHQKNGAGAARHHFAQPRRHRADHFLPHARRADFESGNFRRARQGRRAAAATGTALSQARPAGGEAARGRLPSGEHQRRMVSLRLRPRAQRPAHLRSGAHPVRQADGQNF